MLPALKPNSVTCNRHYTTQTKPPTLEEEAAATAAEKEPKTQDAGKSIPPEKWIKILENTASAPWLGSLPPVHEDRLKRAYALLFQIVIYLGRPQDAEEAGQYLLVRLYLIMCHVS